MGNRSQLTGCHALELLEVRSRLDRGPRLLVYPRRGYGTGNRCDYYYNKQIRNINKFITLAYHDV